MKRTKIMTSILLALTLALSACVPEAARTTRKGLNGQDVNVGDGSGGSGGGQGAGPGEGTLDGSLLDSIMSTGSVELRHIIDPETGNYRTKVSIPKNFNGYLFLSGLNVTSLSNRLIKVRFKFGREMEPITLPAVVTRGEGITPATDIEVLAINMKSRPFDNIRLIYDLFDYNNYYDANNLAETKEPVQDPLNGGLYCRGLKLEHDPTFKITATNPDCDAAGETCLYAYAKILDGGLVNDATNIRINPSEPQIDVSGAGYSLNPQSEKIKRCLPDNVDPSHLSQVLGISPVLGGVVHGSNVLPGYRYEGPYRVLGQNNWEIKSSAVFSQVNGVTKPSGIFQESFAPGDISKGYNSFLFPRAGKMNLQAGVEHFSSSAPFDPRTLISGGLVSAGNTDWMDGCNRRVSTYNSYANETIASCNVSATIEILATDSSGQEVVLNVSNAVKLQLTRASTKNYDGQEMLYSSLNSCTNSSACGGNECCFNSRCWSKEIVSQCLEDVDVIGGLATGESCSSDYECSSFCCNQSTNSCAVHVNSEDQQVLCGKSPGQACVAKEWCRKENIPKCFKVKTGITPEGQQLCALRCYNVPTHGNCVNRVCVAPIPETPPAFDPEDPQCADAIDPPTGF
jgi:hypothetical protein